MYSYAGNSATASKVTPFTAAPQVASPAASTTQAAAVTAATALRSARSRTKSIVRSARSPHSCKAWRRRFMHHSNRNGTIWRRRTGPLSGLWQFLFGSPTFPGNSLSAVHVGVLAIRGRLLQHRRSAVLQHRYGQLDGSRSPKLSGRSAVRRRRPPAAVPKGLPGLGGPARRRRPARGGASGQRDLDRQVVGAGLLVGARPGAQPCHGHTGQQRQRGSRRGCRKPAGRHAAGRGWHGRGRRRTPLRIPTDRDGPPTCGRIAGGPADDGDDVTGAGPVPSARRPAFAPPRFRSAGDKLHSVLASSPSSSPSGRVRSGGLL